MSIDLARNHTPRDHNYPTHGGRVARVARAKGAPLLPWQAHAADVAHEYDPDTGMYRYGTVVVSVPRQAGKTKLEGDVADAACLWRPRIFVRVTMQDGKTADEWMREQHFVSLEGSIFEGRYRESRRAGSHGLLWKHSGSSFQTFPPTRKALHSKQSDLVFVDEAWAHDEEAGRELRQAIRPTMNTRNRTAPGAQLWIVSTRGDHRSAYLDEYLGRGLASLTDPHTRTCFVDYGITEAADPDDLDAIAAAHPAYGHTIHRQSLLDAYDDFRDPDTGVIDLAGWARAYGNRGTASSEIVFPETVWTAAARPLQPVPERAGLALDVSPDGQTFALVAAWRTDDGHAYLDVLDAGPARRDTPDMVARVARARGVPIHVERQAYAALEMTDRMATLDEFDRPAVEFVSTGGYAAACAALHREIYADTAHHPNDPDLDAAVESAGRRDVGDGAGWAWSRKRSAAPIPPLVAATLAMRAADLLPAPPLAPVAIAG